MRPRDEAKRRIPDDVRPRFTKKRWGMRDRDARVTLVRAAGAVGGPGRDVRAELAEGAYDGIRIPRSMRPVRRKRTRDYWQWAEVHARCPICERPPLNGRCPTQD